MKIDLGCGQNKKRGFTGVDCLKMPGVDIVCNLDKEKLPLEDNSVSEIFSMHFLEHTTDLIKTMNEIWRVCKNGAKLRLFVPYFTSIGAFRDPTHKHFLHMKHLIILHTQKKFLLFIPRQNLKLLIKNYYFIQGIQIFTASYVFYICCHFKL